MKRSFVYPLLFYILGILIFYFVDIPSKVLILMLFIVIAYLLYNIIKKTFNQSFLLCLFLMFGILTSFVNARGYLENFIGEKILIEAQVVEEDKKSDEYSRYIIKANKINGRKISKEKSMLTVIGEENFKLGSTILFKGEPRSPKINRNPKLFNYKTYLKSKKIHTAVTIKDFDIEKIYDSKIPLRYRLKEKSIQRIEETFKPYLNEENNSLLTSIILGNSDYLSDNDKELYRDMGLAHILAVSGLHIGIISSALMFMISRLGIKRKANVLITLLFIWSYGFIIGYPASILRASILFSFLYLSKILHKPYDSLNILCLAALILLFINPYSLFSVGFQLSFLASGSIILFSERISDFLYPMEGKFTNTLSSLVAVNIGLSPVQAYYFNKISIIGFLANVIIVPVLSFSLILGFLMVFLSIFFPIGNMFLGGILNSSLSLQFYIIRLIDKLPISTIRVFSPEIISIICIFIFIFILLGMVDIRKLNRNITRVMLVYMLFLSLINALSYQDMLELHFIDVGQGDSLFIRQGSRNILVDTGGSIFKNSNIPEKTTIPYLEKLGIKKLDGLFISHFHEDHCQGVPGILEKFEVSNIFAGHEPTEDYIELLKDNRFKVLSRGDKISIGKGLTLDILWPQGGMDYEGNLNNKSMVGVLSYKNTRTLLTGDMEKEVEEELAPTMGSVDILKVAHHGSDTSSTEDFLEKIDPKIGVISVGEGNNFNHPSKSVIDVFKGKADIYRTDKNGLVKIILDDKVNIETYLKDGSKEKTRLGDYVFRNYNYFWYNIVLFIFIYVYIRYYWKEKLPDAI